MGIAEGAGSVADPNQGQLARLGINLNLQQQGQNNVTVSMGGQDGANALSLAAM